MPSDLSPRAPGPRPLVVTTSGKLLRRGKLADAREIAQKLGVPYVPRSKNAPLSSLLSQGDAVLVVRGDGVHLEDGQGGVRFSPGMAQLRIKRLDDAVEQPDGILVAGEIREGDSVIDCTLGLGQDALVLARAVGPTGRVVGVEKSFPLYALVSTGLDHHDYSPRSCRVECIFDDALHYLQAQPDASVDCVYFDPMFGRPQRAQPAFAMLRRLAEHAPLTPALIEEARRVAKRWVVVKDAPQATELVRLKLPIFPFKRSADLRFSRLQAFSRG